MPTIRVLACALLFTLPLSAGGQAPESVDFRRDVLPILDAKCLRCHGEKQRAGKLDLRTRQAMLRGGNSGTAIEPGKADKSLLVELIRFNEMPPKKDMPRVSSDELKLIKAWINAGAPDSPSPSP